MAKLSGWLITIIGIILVLPFLGVMSLEAYGWLVPVLVLILGVTKLARNYNWMGKKRR